jgi:hypothetical protein
MWRGGFRKQNEIGAVARAFNRYLTPDATAGAGDEYCFRFERHHASVTLIVDETRKQQLYESLRHCSVFVP